MPHLALLVLGAFYGSVVLIFSSHVNAYFLFLFFKSHKLTATYNSKSTGRPLLVKTVFSLFVCKNYFIRSDLLTIQHLYKTLWKCRKLGYKLQLFMK